MQHKNKAFVILINWISKNCGRRIVAKEENAVSVLACSLTGIWNASAETIRISNETYGFGDKYGTY